ncbi:acyl carrier protein [Kordia sp.]|uniref:acyl carrier protein n=1 Tax=Kordia sp. TaxID=1965332 RepID=UPI003D267FD6
MKESVYEIVIENLSNQLEDDIKITADSRLKEDLGFPSIKMIMFFTAVTKKLNISIMDFTDYELINIETVNDVTVLLTQKLQKNEQN